MRVAPTLKPSAPPVRATLRSSPARSAMRSIGRIPLGLRRPSLIEKLVPGMTPPGTAEPIIRAAALASSGETPERASMLATLSPLPSLANSSIFGRSGACDSGSTSALAAIRPPVREPAPNGAMARSRYCTASAGPTWSAGAAGIGSNGMGAMKATVAHSRLRVATPRHQRHESPSSLRSTIRSRSLKAPAATAERGRAGSGQSHPSRIPPLGAHVQRHCPRSPSSRPRATPSRRCHCHG